MRRGPDRKLGKKPYGSAVNDLKAMGEGKFCYSASAEVLWKGEAQLGRKTWTIG
jgi:hypothetical protein